MKENEPIQFKLMLPRALKTRVEERAVLNRRSVSQEIVTILKEKYTIPKPEKVSDPAAKILFWLAGRIRRRNPKSGSLRDKQAALYEGIATDIEARMKTIEGTTRNEN